MSESDAAAGAVVKHEIQLDRRGLHLAVLSIVGAAALGAVGILMFDLPNGLALGMAAGAMVGMTLRMSFVVNNETRIRIADILRRRFVGSGADESADAILMSEFERLRSRLWIPFAFLVLFIIANAVAYAISGDTGSALAVLLPSLLASAGLGFRE